MFIELPDWLSAAASHLRFHDHVVLKAVKISDGFVIFDLQHSLRVAALCMFYKISF